MTTAGRSVKVLTVVPHLLPSAEYRFVQRPQRRLQEELPKIQHMEDWINTLPRKILDYKTPQECFDAVLKTLLS